MGLANISLARGRLGRACHPRPIRLVALGLTARKGVRALLMHVNHRARIEQSTNMRTWSFHSVRGPSEFKILMNPGERRKFFRASSIDPKVTT